MSSGLLGSSTGVSDSAQAQSWLVEDFRAAALDDDENTSMPTAFDSTAVVEERTADNLSAIIGAARNVAVGLRLRGGFGDILMSTGTVLAINARRVNIAG